jgi:hypothetical protein
MKKMITLAALTAIAMPATAQISRELGAETTISLARAGGIRAYIVDKEDHSVVHMQDQRQRWYRVKLSGECLPVDNQATLITRTRFDNRLDRQSFVGSNRYPGRVCGIDSIVNAAPPPGTPEADRQK